MSEPLPPSLRNLQPPISGNLPEGQLMLCARLAGIPRDAGVGRARLPLQGELRCAASPRSEARGLCSTRPACSEALCRTSTEPVEERTSARPLPASSCRAARGLDGERCAGQGQGSPAGLGLGCLPGGTRKPLAGAGGAPSPESLRRPSPAVSGEEGRAGLASPSCFAPPGPRAADLRLADLSRRFSPAPRQ